MDGDPLLRDEVRAALIAHEEVIAKLLKIRNPPKRRKRIWEHPNITSSALAVITVALGSLLGYCTQTAAKGLEFELVQREAQLKFEREIIANVADVLASVLTSTEDRLLMARGEYDALPDSALDAIWAETNAVDARWRREKERSGILLQLYFAKAPAIAETWEASRDAMDVYSQCAESVYVQSQQSKAPADACAGRRRVAQATLGNLRDALVEQYRTDLSRRWHLW